MADDLRQRIAEAIANAECEKQPRCADCMADAVMSVVEDEALDRMTEHFVNETKVRSMDFRNGMSMDLEPARELAAVWVGCARGMLGDAPNYTETKVTYTVSLAGEVEEYAFTLQRVGKLTPHEARQRAERERDEWRERAERAGTERDELRSLIRPLTYATPCEYDHDDHCQAHSLHSRPCPHARAQELLAALDALPEETTDGQ
ncbi:hypothetical protein E1286_05080 [Nonomuraea terrae]|uniref:Uncharacterized protein n=1 Tax=Nonomuraea terrae TaxID=2530383 RepID=A0A4R4Z9B3_9ACTN|nr:hypothetical protein [Nonomuraea terrae]TDD54566.1 hypothetical protein E1286_05080 [Nonomuraea terrae]